MVLLTIRIPAELRDAVHAKAAERGEYLSEVVRRALVSYVKRK